MKKVFFITLLSTNLFYPQMPVTDAATGAQLTALNTQSTLQNNTLASQLTTAGSQLTQLEKTYEQVKKAAEKIEQVNNAIDSAQKVGDLIEMQKEAFGNLDTYMDNVKKMNGKVDIKQVEAIIGNLSKIVADLSKVVTNGIFNMTDKERIDYMEVRKKEVTNELLKSRLLKVLTTK
jgi:flagellar biosynthesis chaperone FliJ